MLQNRVDPSGNLIATTARGSWMGNRGVIHNAQKEITKICAHKAWIICKLEFKGRKRTVMTPGRWTELFFLDEATALSAGHRPCFECRRADAVLFKECWIKGNPSHHFTSTTSINRIDEVIHRQRVDRHKKKVLHQRKSRDVPNGAFVLANAQAHIFLEGKLYPWTPFGYGDGKVVTETSFLDILTPDSIVNALHAGYVPQMGVAPEFREVESSPLQSKV